MTGKPAGARPNREPDTVLTVRIIPDADGGFTADCPELPGCFSQGETRMEALRNIADAAAAVIELEEGR